MQYKKGSEVRKADYPIDKIFLNRWSPRAMSGEELTDTELFTLFEAARWAPSNNNEQPWRFIYAKRDTKHFDKFFKILGEFNQLWTKNASVLICLVAKRTFTAKEPPVLNRNNMSDSGSAWENLALQASVMGLVAHGMAGFNVEKARKDLKVPDDFDIVHMIAIGKHGPLSSIPERMQKSEVPNSRRPVAESIFEGEFKQ